MFRIMFYEMDTYFLLLLKKCPSVAKFQENSKIKMIDLKSLPMQNIAT